MSLPSDFDSLDMLRDARHSPAATAFQWLLGDLAGDFGTLLEKEVEGKFNFVNHELYFSILCKLKTFSKTIHFNIGNFVANSIDFEIWFLSFGFKF